MPITYVLTHDTLEFTTTGDVEFADGIRTLTAGLATARESTPTGQRGWHLLFDIRESTENRTLEEIWDIAHFVSVNRSILSCRCAIIPADRRFTELTRAFGAFVERHGVHLGILPSLDQARAWLRMDNG